MVRLTLAVEVGCFPWLDSAVCSVAEVAAVAAGRSPAVPLTLTLAVAGVDVVRLLAVGGIPANQARLLSFFSPSPGSWDPGGGWPSSFSWWLDTLMLLLL